MMDGWVLYLALSVVLFGLSFLSGMMGLGVAFIATPVLAMFGLELKHEIMPLSLWLNEVTAISGAVAFARKGMVDWRTAIPLLAISTVAASGRGVAAPVHLHRDLVVAVRGGAVVPGIPDGVPAPPG